MTAARAASWTAATAAGALMLAGCSLIGSDDDPEPDRTVRTTVDDLPSAEPDSDQLPYSFAELPAFTPPWSAVPQYSDGVFLGLAETDGVLEFTAADVEGNALWQVQRPASCSGYSLSSTGEDGIAILADVTSEDDAIAATSASGYDLRTGELQWGPVDVPGAHQGPGPVYASPSPASAIGDGGPRIALDPLSGDVIADEGEQDGLTVVGVYDDVLITATDGEVIGRESSTDGEELWRMPADELDPSGELDGTVRSLAGVDAPPGYAVVTQGEGDTGAVIDTESGSVINTDVRDIGFDPGSDMLLTLDAQSLGGFSEGEAQWSHGVEEDMDLVSAGGVLAYLRSDTSVQVINTMTGEDAVVYPEEATSFAIPQVITESGAGVFSLDELTLIGVPAGPE